MSDYTKISNYEFKRDIGEGNFGKVKLGIFKKTGEEFAIKILNKKMIKIKMKNTVFKENEIITKFNHVNVIFVFNIIEDKDNYYIIMEYCKSGELFDYIVEHQHLEEDEAAFFFYQLINGVEYIHSLGVAHRDLKPENLLLTNNKILKIIDFGLSHEFNGEDYLRTKCGSPSYAAPEIIKGLPYDGFKTDIWCCGIILYAMVCGYLPFEGDNNKILFKNIVECNPEIPEYLSEETQDLISSILMPDPDDRITIEEIKKHDFYLRGKDLCTLDYPKIQKMLKDRRYQGSINNSNNNNNNNSNNDINNNSKKSNEIDIGFDDVKFNNNGINIASPDKKGNIESIDNNDIVLIEKNKDNDNNENNNNQQINSLNKYEDNSNKIIIKNITDNSTSKFNNNSKYDTKIENIKKKERKKEKEKEEEEEKNNEVKRHFQFNKKNSSLTAFRDKIFTLKKNIKKIENYHNNLNVILKTDIKSIVNNKIYKNPIYNSKYMNNNKNNYIINTNDLDSNTNNINTISSTIKNNYTNNINLDDINNNISTSSKNKINHILKITDKDKHKINTPKSKVNNFSIFKNMQNKNHNKKIGDKYNINLNDFNRKVNKSTLKNNIMNLNSNYHNNILNNQKNNINIINNFNNTINNYGTLNIVSTINNNNNILYNNKSNKRNKFLSEKVDKFKKDNNTFNVLKDIYNNQKRDGNSYRIPKINKNTNYNNITKDKHSTKSSNSASKKINRSNNASNSKSYKNKKIKNSSNRIGSIKNKGFKIKPKLNNTSHNNIVTSIDNKKYLQYQSLNTGNKYYDEGRDGNYILNSNNLAYNSKKITSNSGNNTKRNNTFYRKNMNANINKSENRINNIIETKANPIDKNNNNNDKSKKYKNECCFNFFNNLSTMFLKTENNYHHKNKFKNMNTSSFNSKISKNSKNSRVTSNNSKSSKSSKSSKKKYNLIRRAKKYNTSNFIFNRKGGSEGKSNRFIQHSKLLNMNTLRNNNFQNVNTILDNYMVLNNNINSKGKKMPNNIKIIKQKGNKTIKVIYNQINLQTLNNMYNSNHKNKKKLPYITDNIY